MVKCFAIVLALSTLVPSEKALYYMIGGYYVTNVEGIKDLPPTAVKAANQFLNDYIEEKKESGK
mgnify:FL=1